MQQSTELAAIKSMPSRHCISPCPCDLTWPALSTGRSHLPCCSLWGRTPFVCSREEYASLSITSRHLLHDSTRSCIALSSSYICLIVEHTPADTNIFVQYTVSTHELNGPANIDTMSLCLLVGLTITITTIQQSLSIPSHQRLKKACATDWRAFD